MKINAKALVKSAKAALKKNGPIVGIAAGIITGAATIVVTAKKAVEAKEIIDDMTKEKRVSTGDTEAKLTPKEIIRGTWKKVIIVPILYAVQIALILSAFGVTTTRYKSLLAAYGLLASTHEEYVEKVIETVGKEKEKMIQTEVAKDHMAVIDKMNNKKPHIGGSMESSVLFVDLLSGREFYADKEFIRSAVNSLNKKIIDNITYGVFSEDTLVMLNDYYDEINLPRTDLGDTLGWCYEASRDSKNFIDVEFIPIMASDGATPAIGIRHTNPPRTIYDF